MSHRVFRPLIAAALLSCGASVSAQVVISQVYGGGGNSGAPVKSDFIELHNNGSTDVVVPVGGWSVQYTSASGTTWAQTNIPAGTTIPAGRYLLIREAQGAGAQTDPWTFDITGSITMSGTAGKVALVDSQTLLGCGANCDTATGVLDFVGFGGANDFEGTGPTAVLSNANAAIRKAAGCTDSNDNSADFDVGAPAARNSASAAANCGPSDPAPSVDSTVPTDGATNIAVGSDIAVTFSESVTVNAFTFTLECDTVSQDFTLDTTTGTTITLDPDNDLPAGATCNVDVFAAQVADSAAQNMASNYEFSFGTLAATPTVTITSLTVSQAEGDAGVSNAVFTLDISPAPTGTVSFDATVTGSGGDPADASDFDAAADFGNPVAVSFDGTSMPPYTVSVPINGDTTVEANETFTLTLDNFTGTDASQTSPLTATGTIQNDDATPIGEVQGDAAVSPSDGDPVTVAGIVTAKAAQGFWIQDGGDGDPATSDGIFVFCGANYTNCGITTSTFAVGAEVQVVGTVLEYIPTADPRQLPLTEITGNPVVSVLQAGPLSLPTPVTISVAQGNAPTPAGGLGQLERYEGMRVTIPELTVTGPTDSDVFFGTVTDASIARPFREPGIDSHDHAFFMADAANAPEWDASPENLRIKTRHLLGNTSADFVNVSAGERVTGVTGVLDYGFRHYSVLTAPGAQPTKVAGTVPTGAAITARTSREITIGSFNIEWLGTEATAGAPGTLAQRLDKLKVIVRDYLHDPDVLGLVEIKDQATVDALTAAINGYAATTGAGAVQYVGEMVTPDGDQNLAILWNEAALGNGAQRVLSLGAATEPTEQTAPELECPNGTPVAGDPLHDRPPLVKNLRITAANGESLDVTVVVNHLKSLIGVDSTEAYPAAPCFADEGTRNRAKRQQQAEDLALLVDELEGAQDDNAVILVGDFNAFQFNDGFVDMMSVLSGIAFDDDTTVQPDDGASLFDPDLFNLSDTPAAATRYSYVHDGNAQVLDQVVVNQAMIDATLSGAGNPRVEYAHVNADFCNFCVSATGNPLRSSDHDPVLGYFAIDGFGTPPVISAITAQSTDEDTASTAIAFTITDAEDGAALVCSTDVTGASSDDAVVADASVVVAGAAQSCTVTVTPVADASGTSDITLTVTDSDGDTDTSTFTLTVNAVNDAPTISAIADTSVAEDGNTSVNFTVDDIDSAITCANVSASSGTPSVILDSAIGVSGAAQACAASLTPAGDAVGNSLVTLTVSDGTLSANEQFTLTVTPVNDTPSFSILAATSSNEDAGLQTVSGFASAISAGPANESGQVLSFNVTGNTNAALFAVAPALAADGTLTYTAAANANGTATITVTLSDNGGGSNTSAPQSFTITVTAVNDAPTFDDDQYQFSVTAGAASGTAIGTVSATDIDGDDLTYSIVNSSVAGAVQIDADTGAITVDDAALLTINVSPIEVTVFVSDGNGGQDVAQVVVVVTAAPGEHIFGNGFED